MTAKQPIVAENGILSCPTCATKTQYKLTNLPKLSFSYEDVPCKLNYIISLTPYEKSYPIELNKPKNTYPINSFLIIVTIIVIAIMLNSIRKKKNE